jgi:hypothetical protein
VWVLVTNWNPLTIWIFDKPYIRFGAEDYNTKDLNNLYIHLTNNSIAKNSNNFTNSEIEGNMWEIENFIKYLEVSRNNFRKNTNVMYGILVLERRFTILFFGVLNQHKI